MITRWLCGLFGGHEDQCAFEGRRMFCRCLKCGRETPGLVVE